MEVALSLLDLALVTKAEEIVASYGDGKNHTTAAAARSDDGRIVTGLNVYHFTGGPCAELVVIGTAAGLGIQRLETITAVGDEGRGILNPCGRCRQILLDYHPDIKVIISTGTTAKAVAITDLIPWWNKWDQDAGTQPTGPQS